MPAAPAPRTLPPLDAGQNFGALTRTIRGADLVVNSAGHAPGMVVPPHEHSNAYLCIVLQGGFELQAVRGGWCPAGSLIAHPAGHRHANRFADAPARCMNIHFGPAWLADASLAGWLADFHRVALSPRAPALHRLAAELQAADAAAPLAAAAAAIELVAEAMRAPAPALAPPAWLQRVFERLHDDPAPAPGLTALAADAGVHPAHLARSFRQRYGLSVGDYLRQRRLEQAERALAGPSSLAEIAAAAGFADQAHFTRAFRRQFGLTPGARRRQMQSAF